MSEASENDERPIKKRRGSGNIETIMKTARLKGQEFVTTKGRLVDRKQTGPDCNCRNMCSVHFSDEQKAKIINTVYNGRPKNEQDTYLIGLIERHEVERHRPKGPESRQIKSSFKYHAMRDSDRIEVCRTAFANLHTISNKIIFRLTTTLDKGDQPVDMRGRHGNQRRIPTDILIKINEHIESYPQKTSHYSSLPITYLEAGLTCKKMHGMFIEKQPELKDVIKYEYF